MKAEEFFNQGVKKFEQGDLFGALSDWNEAFWVSSPLASFHYELGNLRRQWQHYQGAIAIDPTHANAYYNRGNLRYGLGDIPGAIEDYTIIMRLPITTIEELATVIEEIDWERSRIFRKH